MPSLNSAPRTATSTGVAAVEVAPITQTLAIAAATVARVAVVLAAVLIAVVLLLVELAV